MNTILGQPYLVLDKFVNTKSFDKILDTLILAVAKSSYAQGPTYTGPGYIDRSQKSIHETYHEIISDQSHPYHKLLKDLKNWEPYYFVKYKWPGHTLGQCLVIRDAVTNSYLDKDNEEKCRDHPIKANFSDFLTWIDSQNIFSSIGRIVVFLNEAGTSVLEHMDYPDGISRKDQFIWIAPLGNKNFFVRDDKEKHFFNGRFIYFDNSNIHGSDVIPQSTFSIRIDGKFSETFLKKTKLSSHIHD